MQTSYRTTLARGLPGYCEGKRESVPGLLPQLPQITTVTTANGAGSTDWAITIVDDETGQSYTVTATGSATEATLDANMEAAIAAHADISVLFTTTVTSVSDVVATFTARHTNRSYTFTATGGTGANTVAVTQAAGGSGLNFGRFVARGTNDGEIQAVTASTALANLVGALVRTDANSSRGPANDTLAAADLADRGKDHEVLTRGRMLVQVEEAVTPASEVWLRVATTSGAGRVGGLRASAVGATGEILTFTPTVDHGNYQFEYGYRGRHYVVNYSPTDNTTSVADACAGLEDAALDGKHADVTVSAGGTTAITLTLPVGRTFDYARTSGWGLDTEATDGTTALSAGDADAINISSIAKFVSTAPTDGLAVLAIDMGPA